MSKLCALGLFSPATRAWVIMLISKWCKISILHFAHGHNFWFRNKNPNLCGNTGHARGSPTTPKNTVSILILTQKGMTYSYVVIT